MSAAWSANPGDEIDTRQFGPAVFLRPIGAKALVRLSNYGNLEVEVELGDIAPIANSAWVEAAKTVTVAESDSVPAKRTAAAMAGDAGARKSVEALRFGLVPDRHIAELTLGMEELEAWIAARLPSARGGQPLASAITGPFGTGKSHTMEVVRHIARREGYVVARVEVDGSNVSLSSPSKLLNRLWTTLGGKGLESFTPVLDLYLKAIEAGKPAPSIAPRGIDRIKHNYEVVSLLRRAGQIEKHGPVIDGLLSSSEEVTAIQATRMFSREPNVTFYDYSPKPMIGKRVQDRPYDFVEVLAGHATVAQLAGFKGLVITIDEFEVEQNLSWKLYERVNDLLALLAKYFAGETDYEAAPLALFFATVGGKGHEGDAAIDTMLADDPDGYYYLSPWSEMQRRQLAERLHRLYCQAYGENSEYIPGHATEVEQQIARYGDSDSGLIRAFIKRYIAVLDSSLGPRCA
jgi:hypothetical protein